MGDTTDNIGGLPYGGDVLAYAVLDGLQTEEEMFQAVWNLYYEYYEDEARASERMLEDGRLLWMCRELHEDGSPVMWAFPFEPEIREQDE